MSLARGVLLGAPSKPDRLTIHVPAQYAQYADEPLIGHCTVPGCGARFYKGQEDVWQKHVGDCARRNMDRIQAEVDAHRASPFNERHWDPEVAQHLRKVGERMKREGRYELLPSEAAGM